MPAPDLDVLIVGAGLAGIGAACRLTMRCPEKRFALFEARASLGGTWDFFRYPGVRSDTDMYTLGYPFRPWSRPEAIADGADILAYIRETADAYGVTEKIRLNRKVTKIAWSSADALWTVDALDPTTGATTQTTCRFLFMGSGYYDYANAHAPALEGAAEFRGLVVHPQHWPADLDYSGKRIVIVGSGATAMTLLPTLAKKAAHVTMLQRSPTYVVAQPSHDPIAEWLRGKIAAEQLAKLMRWKSVTIGAAFHAFCKRFPERAGRFLVGRATAEVPDVPARHFTPRYAPWDQRLCVVPNSDLFAALRERERASVETGAIRTLTADGIELESGKVLPADIIVTATGFKVRLFGGSAIEVDGVPVKTEDGLVYRSMMLSGLPNLAFAVGFATVSWTMKCDLASQYVCRLLAHMDAHGYRSCVPKHDPEMSTIPLIHYTSGYALRAGPSLPRQGAERPWPLRNNYFVDLATTLRGPLDDGVMQFA